MKFYNNNKKIKIPTCFSHFIIDHVLGFSHTCIPWTVSSYIKHFSFIIKSPCKCLQFKINEVKGSKVDENRREILWPRNFLLVFWIKTCVKTKRYSFDQVIIELSKKKSVQKKELSKKDLVLYTRKRMQNHSFFFSFLFFFLYNSFIQSPIMFTQKKITYHEISNSQSINNVFLYVDKNCLESLHIN